MRTSDHDELTGDHTASDLAFILENLTFAKSGICLLSVDRPVRDFLLRKIQQR
jgi:hypothetical protein